MVFRQRTAKMRTGGTMKKLTIEQRDAIINEFNKMANTRESVETYFRWLNANTEEPPWKPMDIEKDIDRLEEPPETTITP